MQRSNTESGSAISFNLGAPAVIFLKSFIKLLSQDFTRLLHYNEGSNISISWTSVKVKLLETTQ